MRHSLSAIVGVVLGAIEGFIRSFGMINSETIRETVILAAIGGLVSWLAVELAKIIFKGIVKIFKPKSK
jgi:hypothetical protein